MNENSHRKKSGVLKEILVLRVVFFISVFFVLAFTVFSYLKLKESNKTAHWISNTKSLNLELANIISAVQQAELAEKDFLMTGNVNAVKKYYREKEKSLLHLNNTYKIIPLISMDSGSLEELKGLLDRNFELSEINLKNDSISKAKGPDELNSNILMNIRNEINAIKLVGKDIEEDRSTYFRKTSSNNLLQIVVLGLITIALIILAFRWLSIELKKKWSSSLKIEETSKRLEILFDQSFQLMILLGKKGDILNLNKPACNFLQINKSDAVGSSLIHLISKRIDDHGLQEFGDGLQIAFAGEFCRKEISISPNYEDEGSFDVSFNPIHLHKNVENILIEGRDITEINQNQKMLEEATQLLNSAESIAQIGSFAWNTHNNSLRWSRGCYRIYGLPGDELITVDTLQEYLSETDRIKLQKSFSEAVAEEKSFEVTYSIIVNDEVKNILGTGIVQRDEKGKFTGFIGLLKDITFEKKSAEKIERTLQELKRSNLELEQFAYIASHDLQEPLRKIQAFGDRLKSKYENDWDLPGGDYIQRMQDASRRMQILIDDLLAYSRTGNSTLHIEEVNLNSLIEKVLIDLDIIIQEKKATIQINPLPVIKGVSVQLFQLFQNIIHNAIKFTSNLRDPFVEISSEEIPANEVFSHEDFNLIAENYYKISIRDNGIGFDETYLPKVFVIFERLHGKSEYQGTGIGMAVCKKIMDNHKGIITATSRPGKGSTFYVFLPIQTETWGL